MAYGQRAGGDYWVKVPDNAYFRFRPDASSVIAHVPDGVSSEQVADAYRGVALPMAAQICLGLQAIHASGVLVPGHGVVGFCGPSHAGKTTAAYAFGLRGASLWGDDSLAFSTDGAEPTSIRLPFTPNLRPESLEHFAAERHDQALAEAPEWAEEPLAARCVLEPKPAPGGAPVLERLRDRQAVLSLLGNAFVFRPETEAERRRMLESYLSLAAAVPVYRLARAPTLAGISDGLDALESALAET